MNAISALSLHRTLWGLLLLAAITQGAGSAQAQQTGSVSGIITDATGAVLPGVTVTVSGGNLLVARRQESGGLGSYSLRQIPIGRYSVSFELPGFKTLVHQNVIIEAARNVTLEVTLEVATRAETVTVAGEASLMDSKRTQIGENVDAAFLQGVPNARDVWVVIEETPGIVLDRFNVGGSESGQQSLFAAAGTSWTQNQYSLNGANATDPTALGASSSYYAYDAFEEIQVSTSAHPAEIASPGVFLNLALKSGSNSFHGGGAFFVENESLQSDNLDDSLRASGIGETNRLHRYFDYNLELGGPVMQDRIWFYGHHSHQQIEPFVIGFFFPDFEPGVDLTELSTQILRGSFQLKPQHRLEGLYFRNTKFRPYRDAGRTRPTTDTTLYQDSTTEILQGLYTGIINPNLLLDGRLSLMDMSFPLGEQPDLPEDAFSRIDLASGIHRVGPGQNRIYQRNRWQGYAALSLFRDDWLGGSHDLKFGGEVAYSPAETSDRLTGSLLYYDLFRLPLQVELVSDPVTTEEHTQTTSIFVQDNYTLGRWVFNLGLRFDRWTAGYPHQVKEAGLWDRFFIEHGMTTSTPARSKIVSWNSLAPRLGLTYALTGDGKTIFQASFSRYVHQIGTDLAGFANSNGRASAFFRFNDDNGNRLLDEGEIDFDSPLAVNIPAANDIDPEIKPALTDEVTLGIEREIGSDLTAGASFIYRQDKRLIDDVNVGVPFDRYEEVRVLDPGIDLVPGTEDDRPLTAFNQDAETLGQDRFILTNPEGLDAEYLGLMLETRKRFDDRWQLLASLTVGKSTGYLPGPGWETNEGSGFATPLYSSPNSLVNARGRTFWDRTYVLRVAGSYADFFGLTLAGSVRSQTGQPLHRSILAAQTLDGALLNQGVVELLADRQGFARLPPVTLVDARVEKEFSLGRFGRLSAMLDVFNLLNANTVTEAFQQGRTFGVINKILPPRVLRIGVRWQF